MPAGRPTLYDPKFVDEVVEFCAEGFSLTAFAGKIGVCRDTITHWCNQFPEFSLAANRAKALRAMWWEARAAEVAKTGGTGGQSTMIIFGLKNHAPDEFKERHEVTGKDGGPIAVEIDDKRRQVQELLVATFGEDQPAPKPAATRH